MASADFLPFARKMREAGQPALAIDTFEHYYRQLRAGATGLLAGAEILPVADLPDADKLSAHEGVGRSALGQAVVIKLNGGLATSMGLRRAKSLIEVTAGGATFLDLIARHVLDLRASHEVQLPLVLMNSFRTREGSLAALATHPTLPTGLPLDFVQHKVPKVRAADLSPAASPDDPELEWCPPGHGDIYTALRTSGMLERLLDAGLRYAFVSNADNLGATLDLSLLGWFVGSGAPFAMEVADRTEADKKGGHLARDERTGGLLLRERAQCPPDELDDFEDWRRFRFFNTNNIWLDLEALEATLTQRGDVLGLPLIRNTKPLDPADVGAERVFQLETAMGSAISVFEGAQAVRVPRARFAPVKTTGDLLGVWSDAYLHTPDHRVVVSPARTLGPLVVDLDPTHYRLLSALRARFPHGAPSLIACERLVIRGDIRFGAGVVCQGRVSLEHRGPGQLQIPDGAVLRG